MQNSAALTFFQPCDVHLLAGLWIPDQQNVHNEWPDADDQGRWDEVVVERQRCQHHQDRPRVSPQIHGLRAGRISEPCVNSRSLNALIFSFNSCVVFSSQIKRLIGTDKETLSVVERFVAGSMAGVIAQSTIYPMEVIILSLLPPCE